MSAPSRRLTFVGVGPRGPDGLTPAAVKAVVLAGAVFADDYTALFPRETFDFLQKTRQDPIERLGRERLESGREILEAAKGPGGAVLLVPGDPMAATTHVSLRVAAEKHGISTGLLFAPSVLHTALSEAGLQSYKAGRTVTLPFPEKGFAPASPYEAIAENVRAGLHTLVLLDLRVKEGRFMTANEGLRLLQQMGEKLGVPRLGGNGLAVVLARAGEADCVRKAGAIARLEALEYGEPMHCLIIPGKLHFEEREALKVLCGARDEELGDDR